MLTRGNGAKKYAQGPRQSYNHRGVGLTMITYKKEINIFSFSIVTALAIAFALILVSLNEKNLLNPGTAIFTASIMAGIYYFIAFLRQL